MMTDFKKSLKVNAADSCYYAAFTMYCFFHLMERTNYVNMFGVPMDTVGKIANALMLILLLVRFFSIRFSTEALVCSGVAFLATLITLGVTKSWIPLSVCVFIIAGNDIDVRRLTQIVLAVTVLVFLIVAFGLISGSISSIDSIRPGETRVRHSLGFNQVNALGAVLARICTCVVYLRWNKKPFLSALLTVASVSFLEMVANSRTAELYLLVLICFQFFCYIRRHSFARASMSRICLGLIIGSFLLTIILLFVFSPSNGILMAFSESLSNRIYSMWYLFEQYLIHPFGNGSMLLGATVWTGSSYAMLTIDNAWALWLINYGFVPTSFLLIGLMLLYARAPEEYFDDGSLIVLALYVALFGFCESTALAVDYNPLLVLISYSIFRNRDTLSVS